MRYTSNRKRNAFLLLLSSWMFLTLSGPPVADGRNVVQRIFTKGSPVKNCDRLISVLDGITDNSAAKPYLLQIDPGNLDCRMKQIVMKEFIDIEGSGRGVTIIRGSAVLDGRTVVATANNTELRSLTVEAVAAGNSVAAIGVDGTLSNNNARISDVAAHASGGDFTFAIHATGNGAATTLTNVVATTADNVAALDLGNAAAIVANQGATIEMVNTAAIGDPFAPNSIGLDIFGGLSGSTVTARNTIISGTLADVVVNPPDTFNAISTQLTGSMQPPSGGGGILNCVGAYDGNFQALDENCE